MFVGILCSWEQTRWREWESEYPYKQLVEVHWEVLLERTIRMVRERWYDPVIITHNPDLMIDDYYIPEDHKYTISTMLSTKYLREDDNCILLWDVYYTDEWLDEIFLWENIFYGTQSEILAVRFHDIEKRLRKWLYRAYDNASHRKAWKIWTVYRLYEWYGILEHKHWPHFQFLSSDNMDFDFVHEYQQWLHDQLQ